MAGVLAALSLPGGSGGGWPLQLGLAGLASPQRAIWRVGAKAGFCALGGRSPLRHSLGLATDSISFLRRALRSQPSLAMHIKPAEQLG